MLDDASEDIDGMDDDARSEPGQNPPITGRWTATSSYDVYIVDTPEKKDDDGTQDPIEDKPVEAPPKHRCQRRRSRSRREKESNTGTRDNNTPDNAEDSDHPVEPVFERDEWEEGQVNPDELVDHEDSEDSNYLPASEEDVSLGNEDFIVPEETLEQECFKRQLIATARIQKKKQQQLQAE
nr:FK506-binding protein 4-like [Aegilops tauschii subsp. strangulata]